MAARLRRISPENLARYEWCPVVPRMLHARKMALAAFVLLRQPGRQHEALQAMATALKVDETMASGPPELMGVSVQCAPCVCVCGVCVVLLHVG